MAGDLKFDYYNNFKLAKVKIIYLASNTYLIIFELNTTSFIHDLNSNFLNDSQEQENNGYSVTSLSEPNSIFLEDAHSEDSNIDEDDSSLLSEIEHDSKEKRELAKFIKEELTLHDFRQTSTIWDFKSIEALY